MHEAVIEKLRKENLCHKNDLTGCEVWTGEFNRSHEPVATFGTTKVNAREYLYQAASGELVLRGEEVHTLCENDACILPAHLEKNAKQIKTKEPLNEDDVLRVHDLYFQQGQRIDAIVEGTGFSKPYVTKLVAEARSRRSVTQ